MANPSEQQPIIDGVPGMAPYEGPLNTDWANQASAPIDTSKVVGHPDNPFYAQTAAYVNMLEGSPKPSEDVLHVGDKTLEASGVTEPLERSEKAGNDTYDDLFNPDAAAKPLKPQTPNSLSDAEAAAISQHVAKNIDLVKRFGSINGQSPEQK